MAEAVVYEIRTASEKKQKPKDPVHLSKALVTWLYVGCAVAGLSGVVAALSIAVSAGLDGNAPLTAVGETSGGRTVATLTVITSVVQLASFFVLAFLTLKWIYRSVLNARSLAHGLSVTPGWAVGWFFVPVANLWKPFQGLREAWQASAAPDAWRTAPVPGLLRWWWGLYLVSNLLGNASFRMTLRADTVGAMMGSNVVDILGAVVDVALNLVFIAVVRRLCALQVEAMSRNVFD